MSTLSKNIVVAIAINEYDDIKINNLNNPQSDIESILQVLKLKYNFDEFITIYSPEKTTRKYLFNYLMNLFYNSMVDDNILLLFAGHGSLNEKTGVTYWLPRDAEYDDQSSWLNLSDILSFIKISNSRHIAIISDSCFAGAIIEAETRGGGLNAFVSKKSREVLASGSKEKVSDGLMGNKSPFTELLVSLLNSNNNKNLLFNALSIELIHKFDAKRNQTPTYGTLINTGHDGGSFVFELLEYGPSQDIKQVKFLMTNLYLEVDASFISTIDLLKSYLVDKNKAVKSQNFQKAVEIRDNELSLIDKLINELNLELDNIDQAFINDEKRNKVIEILSLESVNYSKKVNDYLQNNISPGTDLTISENLVNGGENSTLGIPIVDTIPVEFSEKNNPIIKKFRESQNRYYESYKVGLLKLYSSFANDFIGIDNQFVLDKYTDLVNIIFESYKTQIILSSSNLYSEIRRDRTIIELHYKILTWLD